MPHPKILVTGATGKTGGAVVAQLRERGWPVRALVHSRDARSERLDRLGAETVVADLFSPEALVDAMQGCARAYYCPPIHPYMIQSAAAFAVAAREVELESIVGLSQWLSNPSHPALLTRQHWLTDRLLKQLPDVAVTIVNPGFFASVPYMQILPYAATLGIFPMPARANSRNAPPSDEDIARVSVAALIDPDRHAGKTYRPTGPKLISIADMAQILSRVLGRTVRHVQLPMWLFLKAARTDGFTEYLLSAMPDYFEDHNRGAFEFGAPTDDVFEVTGRQPEDFETIARRYAALPEARRSFGNTLVTAAKFMAIPFGRGLDVDAYARALSLPAPAHPVYSSDSQRWHAEHASAAAAVSASLGLVRGEIGE